MENFSDNELGSSKFKRDKLKLNLQKKFVFYAPGVLSVIAFFIIACFFFWSAPKNFPAETILNIKEGSSLRSLSLELKEKNIIRSRVAFEALVIIYGNERHIALGDYFFEKKLSVFEISRRIATKDRHLAPIKVTIPEGFNVEEIAEVFISKLPNFNKDVFLLEAKKLEGYLFPDTYFFFSEDDEKDALRAMSENFKRKIASVRPLLESSGRTEKDIILMASLVEREAKGDMDRAIIAGILWKRISLGMPLQTDAAPETYKTKGLPAGPIGNPGLEAIKDSINGEPSDFLFYLHDKNYIIHYGRNFEEHKKNIAKYLR